MVWWTGLKRLLWLCTVSRNIFLLSGCARTQILGNKIVQVETSRNLSRIKLSSMENWLSGFIISLNIFYPLLNAEISVSLSLLMCMYICASLFKSKFPLILHKIFHVPSHISPIQIEHPPTLPLPLLLALSPPLYPSHSTTTTTQYNQLTYNYIIIYPHSYISQPVTFRSYIFIIYLWMNSRGCRISRDI